MTTMVTDSQPETHEMHETAERGEAELPKTITAAAESEPSTEDLPPGVAALTRELIRRAYSLLDAYRFATRSLQNASLIARFSGLAVDHEHLVTDLSAYLDRFGVTPPRRGGPRRFVEMGRVWLGRLAGVAGMFRAMTSNEKSAATISSRLLRRDDLPPLLARRVAAAEHDIRAHREILALLYEETISAP